LLLSATNPHAEQIHPPRGLPRFAHSATEQNKGTAFAKQNVSSEIHPSRALPSLSSGPSDISDWNSFFIKIKWIYQDEFKIIIPDDEGRLTNIRAATFYEEYLPYVQEKIIDKIIN